MKTRAKSMMAFEGFRVFQVQGLGFGWGFEAWKLGFRSLGFQALGLGFKVFLLGVLGVTGD